MLLNYIVTHNIKFAGTHNTPAVERGIVRVKCLSQEHDAMPLARLEPQLLDLDTSALTLTPPPLRVIQCSAQYYPRDKPPLKISNSYSCQLKYPRWLDFDKNPFITDRSMNNVQIDFWVSMRQKDPALQYLCTKLSLCPSLPHWKQYHISYKTACYPHYRQLDATKQTHV